MKKPPRINTVAEMQTTLIISALTLSLMKWWYLNRTRWKQDNGFRYFSSRWGLSLCACRPRVVAPPSRHHPHLGAANGLVRPSLLVVWEHMLTHCSRWLEGELSARPAEMAGFIFQCWNLKVEGYAPETCRKCLFLISFTHSYTAV